nr:unnamed protein product [Digitaria exilis]
MRANGSAMEVAGALLLKPPQRAQLRWGCAADARDSLLVVARSSNFRESSSSCRELSSSASTPAASPSLEKLSTKVRTSGTLGCLALISAATAASFSVLQPTKTSPSPAVAKRNTWRNSTSPLGSWPSAKPGAEVTPGAEGF